MPRTKKTTTTTEAPKEKATRNRMNSASWQAALTVGRTAHALETLDQRIARDEASLAKLKDERAAAAKEGDAALERLNAARKKGVAQPLPE